MPPVYAIISFFSYRFFRHYTYYSFIEVGESKPRLPTDSITNAFNQPMRYDLLPEVPAPFVYHSFFKGRHAKRIPVRILVLSHFILTNWLSIPPLDFCSSNTLHRPQVDTTRRTRLHGKINEHFPFLSVAFNLLSSKPFRAHVISFTAVFLEISAYESTSSSSCFS